MTLKQFIEGLIGKYTYDTVRAAYVELGADGGTFDFAMATNDNRAINTVSVHNSRAVALLRVRHASPSGRPSGRLTTDECKTLLDSILNDGCATMCERVGISQASMARAVMGQTVAVETLRSIRGVL